MIGRLVAAALVLVLPAVTFAQAPLSVAASGHWTAPVEVDGQGPFAFVIDTGAEGSAVYARFADAQRLDAAGEETLVGQTGSATTPLVRLATVTLDGRTASNVGAVRLADRADGVALAGIIGLDVLGGQIVAFDFARRTVALGAPMPRRSIAARAVAGGLLAVPVTVNGVRGTAVIDTGARETRINRRFADAARVEVAGDTTTIHGATGQPLALAAARARTASFGGMTLAAPPVRVADLPVFADFGLADEPAMLLGADWLAGLRMVIDFPHRRVAFAR